MTFWAVVPMTPPTAPAMVLQTLANSRTRYIKEHSSLFVSNLTYSLQSQGEDFRLDHIVGDPVGNCQGGDQDITSTVGGDSTVAQTWKEGVTEGFSADGGEEFPVGISITNSDTWSTTDTKTFRQNIDITISPGKKVR